MSSGREHIPLRIACFIGTCDSVVAWITGVVSRPDPASLVFGALWIVAWSVAFIRVDAVEAALGRRPWFLPAIAATALVPALFDGGHPGQLHTQPGWIVLVAAAVGSWRLTAATGVAVFAAKAGVFAVTHSGPAPFGASESTEARSALLLPLALVPLGIALIAALRHVLDVAESEAAPKPEPAPVELSPAEREVVGLLAAGLAPKEIAARRGTSLATVRTQIKRAKRQAGARTLDELAAGRPRRRRVTASQLRAAIAASGLHAAIAATVFAVVLVSIRVDGADRVRAFAACGVLIAALELARRRPALLTGAVPSTAIAVTLGGVAFAAGQRSPLLFLPLVLALITVAVVAPLRAPASAAIVTVCAFAAQLTNAADERHARLLLANAVGLVVLPLAAAGFARRSRLPPPVEPPPSAPPPLPAEPLPGLTLRQSQAVRLISEGHRHAEVAERMDVSVQQVRRLLREARSRSGASTTRELVAALAGEAESETDRST